MDAGAGWEKVEAKATECQRIPAEFLEEERRSMGERWFGQEYLCEFVEQEGAVFREQAIESALRRDVEPLFPGRDYWGERRKFR